eukprot:CAMPEP_0114325130 /NCGR_PEP_ID=MMETSP0059-20121206/28923_1 /TAXON_ID=36894 /ORGANISM="Pyramimonas parkeae, Strain CCMP726" /LENGTH=109 /DNA_ID=CAMNT_0001453809 /DNA_START=613 /DNA_END=941 /DNA_ORIENTATION=+
MSLSAVQLLYVSDSTSKNAVLMAVSGVCRGSSHLDAENAQNLVFKGTSLLEVLDAASSTSRSEGSVLGRYRALRANSWYMLREAVGQYKLGVALQCCAGAACLQSTMTS